MSYTQNFDSSGSPPAGWAWDAAYSVTSTPGGGISPVSSPNVLALAATGSGAAKYGTYGTPDSNGGDTSVSCWFNAEGTNNTQFFESIARGNGPDLSLAGKCYKARLDTGSNILQLIRLVSGSPTTLASVTVSLATPEWYNVAVQLTGSSTTTLAVTVKRRGDGKYLTSGGSWQVAPTSAISYGDTTGTVTGSGYAGISIASRSDNAYADDFAFTDVTPGTAGSAARTEGHDTPSISGHFLSSATLAKTEGRDTPSLVGSQTLGSLAATEGHDTASIGAGQGSGTIAATERRDTAAMPGRTPNAILTVQEAGDTPSIPASFDVLGTIALAETGDVPAIIGVAHQGVLAAVERHDTPSIAGSFGSTGSAAATERGDIPAFVGHTTYAVLAIAEANDRAAIPAVAAGIPPYFKVQEQRDIPLILGGLPVVRYHVYASPASGLPIDYTTPIATVDGSPYIPPPVSVPGAYSWGVRAFDVPGGEEQNVDCVVRVTFDMGGVDISNRPAPPRGLRAFPVGPGAIRVEWYYPPTAGPRRPTAFNVYAAPGILFNYGAPAASVAYDDGLFNAFSATLSGLAPGTTYLIGVRAVNSSGEEVNTSTVIAVPGGAGPLAVVGLTAIASV